MHAKSHRRMLKLKTTIANSAAAAAAATNKYETRNEKIPR